MTDNLNRLAITILSKAKNVNDTDMVIDCNVKLPLHSSYEWTTSIPHLPNPYDENSTNNNYIMQLINNYDEKLALQKTNKISLYIVLALLKFENNKFLLVYGASKSSSNFSKIHVEICKQKVSKIYNSIRQTQEIKNFDNKWETVHGSTLQIYLLRNSKVHKTCLFVKTHRDIATEWKLADGQEDIGACLTKRNKTNFITIPTTKSIEFIADSSGKTTDKQRNLKPNVLCKSIAEAFNETNKRSLLSCYYTLQIDQNFKNVISAKELVNAIQQLKIKLKEGPSNAMDATASLFYEDVSWQMEEATPVPSKFKNSSIDIDQAALYIKRFVCPSKVFCDSDSLFLNHMFTQLSHCKVLFPVNWNGFLLLNKKAFHMSNIKLGGTTYMCKTQKETFINLPTPEDGCELIRISVSRNRKSIEQNLSRKTFFSIVKLEVWNCIVHVAKWWENETTKGNGRKYLNFVKDEESTHRINGGVGFPILCALYYSRCCTKLDHLPQLAIETYGTKQFADSRIEVDLKANINGKLLAAQLYDSCLARNPFVIGRLSKFIVDMFQLTTNDGNFVLGIGCTTETTSDNGDPLMTVFNICPPTWSSLPLSEHFLNDNLDTSLAHKSSIELLNSNCYNDEYIDMFDPQEENIVSPDIEQTDRNFSTPKRLVPFKPLTDKSIATYPIYGAVLPILMQPTTVSCKVKETLNNRLLNNDCMKLNLESDIYRVQQYCPTARYALYEYDRKYPLSYQTGNLASIISQIPGNPSQTLNIKHMKENVNKFLDAAFDHVENIAKEGTQGRMEVAFKCSINEEPLGLLENGINDITQLANAGIKAYDPNEWVPIIQFYLSAIKNRMNYIENLNSGIDSQIARINELVLIIRDLSESIRMFYHGRGFLRSKLKAHSRCSYVAGRPILASLGDYARASTLSNCWLNGTTGNAFELFKTFLKLPTDKSYHAPEFDLACLPQLNKWYEPDGLACSQCLRVFTKEQMITLFVNHECIVSQHNRQQQISVTNELFINNINKKRNLLTTEQKVLLEEILLDNGKNLVVKGGGGAGKTFTAGIARDICYMTYKMECTIVMAVTRSAAKHLHGITFHSFLGLTQKQDISNLLSATMLANHIETLFKFKRDKYLSIRNNLRVILLDECGLASDQVINVLDMFLRIIKDKSNSPGLQHLPFGGVKIVLCGDELQCLPVDFRNKIKGEKLPPLYRYYQADAYVNGNFYGMYFRSIFRQKNKEYIQILERCRLGYNFIYDDDIDKFQKLTGAHIAKKDMLDLTNTLQNLASLELQHINTKHSLTIKIKKFYALPIISERNQNSSLFENNFQNSLNDCNFNHYDIFRPAYVVCNEKVEVNTIEKAFVSRIEQAGHQLHSFIAVDIFANSNNSQTAIAEELESKVPKLLKLCCGMRVQFTSNSVAPNITKNSFGIVKSLTNDTIVVNPIIAEGKTIPSVNVITVLEELYSEDGFFLASRLQMPLRVGIAGTLYNVQGSTILEPMIYNNERQMKDAQGALFTAASRCDDPQNFKCLHAPSKYHFDAHIPSVRNDLRLFQSKERLTYLNTRYKDDNADCGCGNESTCFFCMPIFMLVKKYRMERAVAFLVDNNANPSKRQRFR